MIYLDNILIYSNNMSKHYWHVKKVFKHFCKASLYAKSNDKVKIIQNWPESKKVKNIQSFLGFANFYHQFIFNYLDIVILLTCPEEHFLEVQLVMECSRHWQFFFSLISLILY